MTRKNHLFRMLAVAACLGGAVALSGCNPAAEKPAAEDAGVNIIESTGWAGIWQKYVEIPNPDEDGIPEYQPTNLFKVILANGTYFLFRATPNGMEKSVDSRIEVYGTYRVIEEGKVVENIVTNCVKPELSGIASDVNYTMPDKDHLNVNYNLRNSDGSAGSSEYVPELWQRVSTN